MAGSEALGVPSILVFTADDKKKEEGVRVLTINSRPLIVAVSAQIGLALIFHHSTCNKLAFHIKTREHRT